MENNIRLTRFLDEMTEMSLQFPEYDIDKLTIYGKLIIQKLQNNNVDITKYLCSTSSPNQDDDAEVCFKVFEFSRSVYLFLNKFGNISVNNISLDSRPDSFCLESETDIIKIVNWLTKKN